MQRQPDPAWVRWVAIFMLGAFVVWAFVWPGIAAMATMHYDDVLPLGLSSQHYVKNGWSAVGFGAAMAAGGLAVIGAAVWLNIRLFGDGGDDDGGLF